MKLYEIDEELQSCFDLETGELTDSERFDALTMMRDEKIESIALWIKDLKAEAEALKAEKMAFAARQTTAENKAESLKNYLASILKGQKFNTTKCSVSFRKTEKVKILDELELPPQYVAIEYRPDKAAIKKAIKDGTAIAGAELVEDTSCIIK